MIQLFSLLSKSLIVFLFAKIFIGFMLCGGYLRRVAYSKLLMNSIPKMSISSNLHKGFMITATLIVDVVCCVYKFICIITYHNISVVLIDDSIKMAENPEKQNSISPYILGGLTALKRLVDKSIFRNSPLNDSDTFLQWVYNLTLILNIF